MHIAKKDVIRLINEIKVRMKKLGNDIDIISDDDLLMKLCGKDKQGI